MAEKSFSVPGKIVYENFDPMTHESVIRKDTDLGVIEGRVRTSEHDRLYENGYRGLGYAERKCDLTYHRMLAEKLSIEADGVYKAWQSRVAETGMPDEILADAATHARAEADEQLAFYKKARKALYRFFAHEEKALEQGYREYQRLMKKVQENDISQEEDSRE